MRATWVPVAVIGMHRKDRETPDRAVIVAAGWTLSQGVSMSKCSRHFETRLKLTTRLPNVISIWLANAIPSVTSNPPPLRLYQVSFSMCNVKMTPDVGVDRALRLGVSFKAPIAWSLSFGP